MAGVQLQRARRPLVGTLALCAWLALPLSGQEEQLALLARLGEAQAALEEVEGYRFGDGDSGGRS